MSLLKMKYEANVKTYIRFKFEGWLMAFEIQAKVCLGNWTSLGCLVETFLFLISHWSFLSTPEPNSKVLV